MREENIRVPGVLNLRSCSGDRAGESVNLRGSTRTAALNTLIKRFLGVPGETLGAVLRDALGRSERRLQNVVDFGGRLQSVSGFEGRLLSTCYESRTTVDPICRQTPITVKLIYASNPH